MEFDPATNTWIGNDEDLIRFNENSLDNKSINKNSSHRKPALITNLNQPNKGNISYLYLYL